MEKKVSLTIDSNIYNKLSGYSKSYGVTVRYMLNMLLNDSISNDRYTDIFSKDHDKPKIVSMKENTVQVSRSIVEPNAHEDYDNIISDLTNIPGKSESSKVIEDLSEEFDNKIKSSEETLKNI